MSVCVCLVFHHTPGAGLQRRDRHQTHQVEFFDDGDLFFHQRYTWTAALKILKKKRGLLQHIHRPVQLFPVLYYEGDAI